MTMSVRDTHLCYVLVDDLYLVTGSDVIHFLECSRQCAVSVCALLIVLVYET